MDESEAVDERVGDATPIFGVYRRGYDPEQVDRYVADQQRRLDEALHRSSESERKLAAAVGQLRELHRRVAVYESEARNAQPPQLDTLGERVQRILQEAWEGAYTLRQEAEREVNELRENTSVEVDAMRSQARADVEELREVASKEAADVVDEATRRALHIRDETERRRQAYLERVERDREQAIAQITYLYDQRQGAIAELARLQATVQATVEEMVRSPLGRPAPGVMEAAVDGAKAARLTAGRTPPAGPFAGPFAGPGAAGPGAAGPGAAGPGPGADVMGVGAAGPGTVVAAAGAPAPGRGAAATGAPATGTGVSGMAVAGTGAPPDRGLRGGPDVPAVDSPRLPGGLGAPLLGTGDPTEGSEVPTGPMERFVRPSDRDAARAAVQRGPDAEADAMERVMRKGLPVEPEGGASAGTGAAPRRWQVAATSGQPVPGLRPAVGETSERAPTLEADGGSPSPEADTRTGRGPVLGGLIRPRRQPRHRGVFDVEQDG